MQIIDKSLNKVFKWRSEDVTIPEMLDIIETEILEKSSPSDLVKFEKAMRKTWVLAVGEGFSSRYYSLNSSPVQLCLQFNVFTHSIQQIKLLDTTNKVQYFIPSGKESCKKLQRAVLYRIAQYKEVGMERGRSSGQGGRFLNQHSSPNPMKWVGLSALGIAVAAVALVAVLNWPSISRLFDISLADTPEWVTTVQNGYLGEFTDMTVYDLLDYHRIFFEKEVWDGGTTDSGKQIAEVRFTSQQSSDSATIQFTMLNDEVFKVSAYVDTTMPDAQSSDVIYALTLTYYSQACLKYIEDNEKITQLHALMRKVDACEILYGAAADYSGDRAALYRLGNGSLMGLTASELMEYYGRPLIETPNYDALVVPQFTEAPTEVTTVNTDDIHFEYYTVDELITELDQNALRASKKYKDQYVILTGKLYGCSDDGEKFTLEGLNYESYQSHSLSSTISCSITSGDQINTLLRANTGDTITVRCKVTQVDQYDGYKVETISVDEIAPKAYVPQEEPEPSAPSGMLTGTVLWSTDGLRVRSGPGTNYEAIHVLQPGTAVTIHKQQNVNGTYWGDIGEGWVCMDYVDLGGQQSAPANGSTTDISMTVRVKMTVDALRIRSGPDTSYPEVGRFTGGEILTVTQLQYSDGVQWGRISQGWICMNYVDTVYETQTERNNAQRFVGNWQDQISQRCCLTIEPGEYGIFVIDITWGNSAFSTSMWRAVGNYDATADCIRYHDCDHWESVSDGNGNMTNDYYYTGGQGMLYFSGGNLLWQDNEENTGSRCSFVKIN